MSKKILLTSFQTWLPHQISNSSDDLLAIMETLSFPHLHFLRKLPVDVKQASQMAIAVIDNLQPDVIIACGMAESRPQLSIESHARWQNERLKTSVNLEKLVTKLSQTIISNDAGQFVCEGLYYHLLKYLFDSNSQSQCIFVHVPVLSKTNHHNILTDFLSINELLICFSGFL